MILEITKRMLNEIPRINRDGRSLFHASRHSIFPIACVLSATRISGKSYMGAKFQLSEKNLDWSLARDWTAGYEMRMRKKNSNGLSGCWGRTEERVSESGKKILYRISIFLKQPALMYRYLEAILTDEFRVNEGMRLRERILWIVRTYRMELMHECILQSTYRLQDALNMRKSTYS